MAKGYEENQARVNTLARFGKDLARRARSKCELCESAGVSLAPFEVPPVPKMPEFERCVFLCEKCAGEANEDRKFEPGDRWRCLTGTVWSETPAVQVLAVRLLRKLADLDWARESLEDLYLDPEVEKWAAESD